MGRGGAPNLLKVFHKVPPPGRQWMGKGQLPPPPGIGLLDWLPPPDGQEYTSRAPGGATLKLASLRIAMDPACRTMKDVSELAKTRGFVASGERARVGRAWSLTARRCLGLTRDAESAPRGGYN